MSYRVTLYNDRTLVAESSQFYLSRGQAVHAMRKQAYAVLEGFAKLDTVAAHSIMQQIDQCDDILPPQAQRHVKLSNTGMSLYLANTARKPR